MISVTVTDRERPDAVGPDARAFYVSIRARAAVQRRHQLRARRPRHAAVSRRARAAWPSATSAAIPTPACRTPSASTTSARRDRRRCSAISRSSGFVEHPRRLLRNDAGSHQGYLAAVTGLRQGRCPSQLVGAGIVVRDPGSERQSVSKEDSDTPDPGSRAPDPGMTQLSGLEVLTIRPDSNFQMIGERTNVTGSARFARLISPVIMRKRLASRRIRFAAAQISSTSTWTKACSIQSRR